MAEPRTLLLTRPAGAVAGLRRRRWRRGCPGGSAPVVAPLIAIAPLPGALDLEGVQGLIFTSANGVEQFAARSGRARAAGLVRRGR